MSDHERIEKDSSEDLASLSDHTISPVNVFAQREDSDSSLEQVSGNPPRNQWSPTLRRVSLLNTLLFLGLALSSTKLHAHASTTNGVNSKPSPVQAQSTIESRSSAERSPHMVVDPENTVDVDASPSPSEDEIPLTTLLEVIDDNEEDDPEEIPEEEPSDEESPVPREGFIIVATVDGTLAAIEGSTGRILWKRAGRASKIHQQQNRGNDKHDDGMNIPRDQSSGSKAFKLLLPLTTTTTTAGSTSDSSVMAAIPSINGHVFLTTVESPNDPRTTPNDLTRTETASLKDLVARAPYVDPDGRFYVGSRHTTAAAIDRETGEILYVASAHENDEEGSMNIDPEWQGRSVVWIGRVDYSVSVYNAKTSTKEVQFSASEIMSVNDMLAEKKKTTRSQDPTARSKTSERAPNLLDPPEYDVFFFDVEEEHRFSALVATPSGNLAFRNQKTGRVEWVADEAFETPIAYALHSVSGHSLDVDIIPDVTMPSHSMEYLTREIERQIELTLGSGDDDPPEAIGADGCHSLQNRGVIHPSIVGTLLNGQLYSMPLGRRHHQALPSQPALSTTRVALDLAAVQRHHSDKHILGNKMPLHLGRLPHAQEDQASSANRACGPSSPVFPGCLVKAVSRRVVGTLGVVGALKRKERSSVVGNLDEVVEVDREEHTSTKSDALETLNYQQAEQGNPYYSDHHHNFQQQYRQRNYRKILKILGSWLPPTIALLFVVSFELGRRKRQKDGLDVLKQVTDGTAVDTNELLRSVDKKSDLSSNSSHRQKIQITDEVLGFGGHGTVVFRGTLEGRNVAVKRMLKTYLASADREISLLIESDGHPNVVRYFLKEVKNDFVYLALELCDLSLHTLIGTLVAGPRESDSEDDAPSECISNATRRLLLQIATGVKHLHSLRIVHNDLKPANILLAVAKEVRSADKGVSNESIYNTFQKEHYVAKISDMGLGKMLAGQSSFGASASFRGQFSTGASNGNVGMGPGTVGWMAPEAMRIKSSPSIASDASNSGDASPLEKTVSGSTRASRSVDIFPLGCIFYSTLVPGLHPFGEWYEREANIMHNRPCIEPLKILAVEAYYLVSAMIQHNPRSRPTAKQVCEHPFFWSLQRKLSFICDLSDRLETDAPSLDNAMPPSNSSVFSAHPLAVERNAAQIVGLTWDKALYRGLTEQRYRTYDSSSVRDLLRLIRNKKNHFQDLEASVRQKIGSNTDGLMKYFESCFPQLLMHCYKLCCEILPSDDPLVEKYSLSSASYPTSYTIASVQPHKKSPPVLIEEPLFASQEEISQGEPNELIMPTEEVTSTHTDVQTPEESTGFNAEKSIDTFAESEDMPVLSTLTVNLPEAVHHIDEPDGTCVAPRPNTISSGNDENQQKDLQNEVVLWEGSTAARTLNCRGWIRSDEEWTKRGAGSRKRNNTLTRCAQDPKFRTRLCNHWDTSMGTFCPMKKKNKCVFAHSPVELRVKEGKKGRWGKLVDKNGNNSNPNHSGGEDTCGAARSIESARKEEGKWNSKKAPNGTKKQNSNKKKSKATSSSY